MSNPESSLPPGFRFHPTDEELILHYLRNKAKTMPCPVSIIAEVDIYKFDPWELPAKAMFGEKEWYYFSPRDRKYPNGVRPNRAAVSGYWKATGTDKSIFASDGGKTIIGVKKALVFYRGKPPKGIKTNWIMHEYRLAQTSNIMPMKPKDSSMRLDDRVLCRIYKKSKAIDREEEYPLMQHASLSRLPNPNPNIVIPQKSLSFSDQFNAMDYYDLIAFEQNPILIDNTNNNDSNGYLLQGNPNQVNTSPVPVMDNQHKHGRSMSMNTDETLLHPLKKVMNTCSFTDPSHFDTSQYLVNQPFFNQQQLLLSSPYKWE